MASEGAGLDSLLLLNATVLFQQCDSRAISWAKDSRAISAPGNLHASPTVSSSVQSLLARMLLLHVLSKLFFFIQSTERLASTVPWFNIGCQRDMWLAFYD